MLRLSEPLDALAPAKSMSTTVSPGTRDVLDSVLTEPLSVADTLFAVV